jgi:hypothetical protein
MRTSSFRSCGEAVAAALVLALAHARPLAIGDPPPTPGVLAIRSEPGACAVFVDGVFAGMTGDGPAALALPVQPGAREVRVTHPGRQDAVARVAAKASTETSLLAKLVGPESAPAALEFAPLLGVGQMARARVPFGATNVVRYRVAGKAGERRLLVLQTSDMTARVLDPDAREVPLTKSEPVVELPRSDLFDVRFARDGDHVLEIRAKPGEFAVFRFLAAPPPQSKNADGSPGLRRLPAPK